MGPLIKATVSLHQTNVLTLECQSKSECPISIWANVGTLHWHQLPTLTCTHLGHGPAPVSLRRITPNLASFPLTGQSTSTSGWTPRGMNGGSQVVFLVGVQTLCCDPCGLRVWDFPESQNVPKGPSI